MTGKFQNLAAVAVLIIGFALVALIVATGPEPAPVAPPVKPPSIPVVVIAPQDMRITVIAHGEVLPRTESNLVAEVSGRVAAVSPAMVSGGFFAEGDTLVEIEMIDYRAALEKANARLVGAQSELANAEKAYERLLELSEQESVSDSALDDAVARLALARASYRQSSVEAIAAERDLERTRLVAPFAGRVRSERIGIGQFVNRGEIVATLYSTDAAEVRLPVQDDDLAFLPLSLNRETSASNMPSAILRARFAGVEHAWNARIVRTEGELDPQTRMVHLVAQVDAPYDQGPGTPPLTVGLFVTAEIQGNLHESIFVLPGAALDKSNRVLVVGPDHRLERRPVEVIRATAATVVVDGNLREGEMVAVSATTTLLEGQQVVPVPQAAATE